MVRRSIGLSEELKDRFLKAKWRFEMATNQHISETAFFERILSFYEEHQFCDLIDVATRIANVIAVYQELHKKLSSIKETQELKAKLEELERENENLRRELHSVTQNIKQLLYKSILEKVNELRNNGYDYEADAIAYLWTKYLQYIITDNGDINIDPLKNLAIKIRKIDEKAEQETKKLKEVLLADEDLKEKRLLT